MNTVSVNETTAIYSLHNGAAAFTLYYQVHTVQWRKTPPRNILFLKRIPPAQFCCMKLARIAHILYEVLTGTDTANTHRLLHQQRQLLYSGIEVSAEVIDISLMKKGPGSMHLIQLWIKLKKADDSFIYTHTKTLVSFKSIPEKGQSLRIKYFPENLSSVLVL